MINRTYQNIHLANGTDILTIKFDDPKYSLLSTMLFSDGNAIGRKVLDMIKDTISGMCSNNEVTGNVCRVEVGSSTVKIYDIFSEDTSDYCEIDFIDFEEIMKEWIEKSKK